MTYKNYNIGLFNDCFPPVMDGVAMCVENYAYWMQEKVGGVAVVTPSVPDADYSGYAFDVLDYLSAPVPFRHPYVTGIAEMDPLFVKQILKSNFKIVHAHCPFSSGATAQRIAKLQRIPFIASFHSKYRDDFSRVIPEKHIVDAVIKRIISFYEGADQVWVPQDSAVEVIREYGFRGHVEVVDNGCDLCADYPEKFFVDARQSLGIGSDEFVMLFVGQHIWEKNVKFIIDALEQVKDERFRMFFVGTGYAAEDMKRMVSEKGLDSQVTFVGAITDREKMKTYYAAADLFLFPSFYDTAGIVVREAAALNTPSVMVDGSTAATVLTDGEDGFIIKNDLGNFESKLRELIHDPERVHRVGVQASRSIVRSWEDVVDEVLDRYNQIISARTLIRKI